VLNSNKAICNASTDREATLHKADSSYSANALTTLLLGNTNSPTPSSSRLRVLSTNTETPVVTKTTMSADLLQTFQILTKLGVDTVGQNLRVLAIDDITLAIEEPGWDFVLSWVLDDGDNSLELLGRKFTSTAVGQPLPPPLNSIPPIPLVEIDIGLLADQVGVTTSNTLYLGQGVHDLFVCQNQFDFEG